MKTSSGLYYSRKSQFSYQCNLLNFNVCQKFLEKNVVAEHEKYEKNHKSRRDSEIFLSVEIAREKCMADGKKPSERGNFFLSVTAGKLAYHFILIMYFMHKFSR